MQTIAGVPPLLTVDALRIAASYTLADPQVLAAGELLALIGVALLLCALLPGTTHVLPLVAHEDGAVAGVARKGLARDLAAHARRTEGVTTVKVSVGARTLARRSPPTPGAAHPDHRRRSCIDLGPAVPDRRGCRSPAGERS